MIPNRSAVAVSTWDGTLSSLDFRLAADGFCQRWKKSNHAPPHWCWVPCPKRPWVAAHESEGYLVLENLIIPGSSKKDRDQGSVTESEGPSCYVKDESSDNAILVQSFSSEFHHYDFHVAYSTSYRVPVLYFRAYCSDGQPLELDDIEKDLPSNSVKGLMESKWTFITKEEHPYLNRPWYTLHPCGTCEWMKLLFTADVSVANGEGVVDQYLVSWFSVVGQLFGLRIPSEMLTDYGQL